MTETSIFKDLGLKQPQLSFYVDKIKQNQPFTFVRYGDGEWSCAILGDRIRTGSGSHDLTNTRLKADLKRSLTSAHLRSDYIISLRPNSVLQKPTVGTWLLKNCPKKKKWHDCRVFAHASMKGLLHPLIKAMQNLQIPLIFVGPHWLIRLRERHRIFRSAKFIYIPETDCYVQKSKILKQMREIGEPAFFSISAGPTGKVLCYELYPEIGKNSFLVDFGSLWDVYADNPSRQYHRRIRPNVRKANLGI